MDKTNDSPLFFVLAPLPRKITHDRLHRQRVFYEAVTLIVFFEKEQGFFPAWSF
jgi:hypothetical protein